MDTAVSYGIRFLENVRERMDICIDNNGPFVIMKSDIYRSNYVKARNRDAKIRFITEVTKDNIEYCKQLSEIVSELRHLDGVKGSVCVNDTEFLGMTTWRETKLLNPVIYSNEREVIEHQQYIFEMFWKKAEPFSQKLMEIEDGIVPEFLIFHVPLLVVDKSLFVSKDYQRLLHRIVLLVCYWNTLQILWLLLLFV
jgi:hypothetical protein